MTDGSVNAEIISLGAETPGESRPDTKQVIDRLVYFSGKTPGPFLDNLMQAISALLDGTVAEDRQQELLNKIQRVLPTFSAAEHRLNEQEKQELEHAYYTLTNTLKEDFSLEVPALIWQKESMRRIHQEHQLTPEQYELKGNPLQKKRSFAENITFLNAANSADDLEPESPDNGKKGAPSRRPRKESTEISR